MYVLLIKIIQCICATPSPIKISKIRPINNIVLLNSILLVNYILQKK